MAASAARSQPWPGRARSGSPAVPPMAMQRCHASGIASGSAAERVTTTESALAGRSVRGAPAASGDTAARTWITGTQSAGNCASGNWRR